MDDSRTLQQQIHQPLMQGVDPTNAIIQERNEEFKNLAGELQDLQGLMSDVQGLVHEQGQDLDVVFLSV